ncbi:ATP-binding protein [Nocardiopsis quinghaiensis]|uniref:ATP-binding protein n=1 Tax=Nocardiopsis quinghaiensis TaxID=464995 RepID=UPI00123C339D|nr:ATP-binding protein [Nocardiopsis quinghaiensis]
MPTHFANLTGASTLKTRPFLLAHRIVDDLVANQATGVIHGNAGTGKTYAVQAALESLQDSDGAPVTTCALTFPSRPTMRMITDELLRALTGAAPPRSRNRFHLITTLTDLLSGPPRLVVVDEAQRLNSDCIELLRHLHDAPTTRFALLYVGGDGCWEVLSAEPMLRSRVFRRLPFHTLPRAKVPELIGQFHPIYAGVDAQVLLDIDDFYAHGTLRDWASFTHTAAQLCAETDRGGIDTEIIANAYTLLGGGAYA